RLHRAAMSIALVTLLFPWVTEVVIAKRLPEAWHIRDSQLQAPDPLGALPEVEMWDEQARWAAVLWRNRHTLIGIGDPSLTAAYLCKRQVRGVAAVTEGDHVPGICLELAQQCIE